MKINSKAVLIALIVFAVSSNAESLISDFVSSARNLWPTTKDLLSLDPKQKKIPAIQYELPTENEEFLKKGMELIGSPLNALDVCTHRVVHTLKKNCNQLNMEEIGKLAVMMLNCQLEIEGRQIFPCKPEMTLQQCTMGMDNEMYQVYSYLLHRAVGVCSAMKHDQFRAMTEITVNRLMQASQSQVKATNEALKNQKRISEMEMENIKAFNENDAKIQEAQVISIEKLKHASDLIDDNLMKLQQELETHQKTEEKLIVIEKSADDISSKLDQHKLDLHEGHERLLKEVDEIATNLKKNNQELIEQYSQTLVFLDQFKATSMKNYIDQVLQSLHEIGLELTTEFTLFMMLNILYFVCGMVFMLFIGVKGYSKILHIGLFIFNGITSYSKAEIPLLGFNIFVWFCYLAWKLFKYLIRRIKAANLLQYFNFKKDQELDESDEDDFSDYKRRSVTPLMRSTASNEIKASPNRNYETNQLRNMHNGSNHSSVVQPKPNTENKLLSEDDNEMSAIFNASSKIKTIQSSSTIKPDTPSTLNRPGTPSTLNRPLTPAMRRVLSESLPMTPSRSATPFQLGMTGRVQCQALTAKGLQCRNAGVVGSKKCRVHNYN